MRLIDADALIKEANADGAYGYVDAKQIADAPTVDAVPVTRCRECKHMVQQSHTRSIYCTFWCAVNVMGNDGFCNYGEREEGADNEP